MIQLKKVNLDLEISNIVIIKSTLNGRCKYLGLILDLILRIEIILVFNYLS